MEKFPCWVYHYKDSYLLKIQLFTYFGLVFLMLVKEIKYSVLLVNVLHAIISNGKNMNLFKKFEYYIESELP